MNKRKKRYKKTEQWWGRRNEEEKREEKEKGQNRVWTDVWTDKHKRSRQCHIYTKMFATQPQMTSLFKTKNHLLYRKRKWVSCNTFTRAGVPFFYYYVSFLALLFTAPPGGKKHEQIRSSWTVKTPVMWKGIKNAKVKDFWVYHVQKYIYIKVINNYK